MPSILQGVCMSGERKALAARASKDSKDILSEILDFGPNHSDPDLVSHDVSNRIKSLIKKLQDISQRIDNLSTRS